MADPVARTNFEAGIKPWLIVIVGGRKMNPHDLARLFIRFNALCFVFWAVVEAMEFPGYIFSAVRDHKFSDFETTAKLAFFALIGRLAAQLLAAVFLFGYTDEMISLLTTGRWKKRPIQAAETMRGK